MIKDVILRFMLIMVAISTILITHMAWDIFSSQEDGMKVSSIYHADTSNMYSAFLCMLLSWFVIAMVIREMIRSYRGRKTLQSIFDRLEDLTKEGHRLQEDSTADSWAKGPSGYL